jgi:hypothetical protein
MRSSTVKDKTFLVRSMPQRSSTTHHTNWKVTTTTSTIWKRVDSYPVQRVLVSIVVTLFVCNLIAVVTQSTVIHTNDDGSTRSNRKLQQLYDTPASSLLTGSQPPEPQLVWLMSFPNSGTSYTSQLVRDATLTDSASNYADETPSGQQGLVLPVYVDQPEGPFWIKPEANPNYVEPAKYILTKVRSCS